MTPLHDQDVATSYAAWIGALREAGGLEPPESEVIDVALACGRVSAQAVVARHSSPGFDAAAMDGIAVAAAATTAAPLTLAPGAFARVDTGDPLPPGTDAVVRSEDVVLAPTAALEHEVAPYSNVRQVGEDVAAGDLLLQAGRRLGPADLAVVASAGTATIAVLRRPVVAILPSGDELVEAGAVLRPGEIVETNSLMLERWSSRPAALPSGCRSCRTTKCFSPRPSHALPRAPTSFSSWPAPRGEPAITRWR